MNRFRKIGLATTLGLASFSIAGFHNRIVFKTAVANNITKNRDYRTYKWRFGDISYCVYGKGSPILLIHDLNSYSSSYEWKRVIKPLAKNHKVYVLDLLGCGYSDKPNMTYTAYMYTQLLNDFVVNVITHKVSVIATGDSTPLTIMASYNNPYLFDKIVLVSPQSIREANINPRRINNLRKRLLNTPVIGTFIYTMRVSKKALRLKCKISLFDNFKAVPNEFLKGFYETAHLDGINAKYIFSSTDCHYTTASISRAVSQLDNCIYIIRGSNDSSMDFVIPEYTSLNPAIEVFAVEDTKKLPQIESPVEFTDIINDLF